MPWRILLYVLLGLVLLSFIPLRIKVTAGGRGERVYLYVCFIKIRLFGGKKKKEEEGKREEPKKKYAKKAAEKKTEKKEKKKSIISHLTDGFPKKDFGGQVRYVCRMLKDSAGILKSVLRFVRIDMLRLYVIAGDPDDAAHTAILYGTCCAAVYPALGLILTKIKIKKYDVRVLVDYRGSSRAEFELTVSAIIPLLLISLGIAGFKLYRIWRK